MSDASLDKRVCSLRRHVVSHAIKAIEVLNSDSDKKWQDTSTHDAEKHLKEAIGYLMAIRATTGK